MDTTEHHEGWELRESGPADADHAVLLVAGALVTAAYYADVLADPRLKDASARFVAATLPGHAGTQPPDDLSMDNYARLAGKLAADFRCDAVVGHSLGANVAIEMLAAGHFSGPLILLSPSFSRQDKSKFPRALDRISRVLGHLPYAALLKAIGPAMKSSLPADRSAALIAEMKTNDPRFLQRQTRRTSSTWITTARWSPACAIPAPGVGRVRRARRHRTSRRRTARTRGVPSRGHRHDPQRGSLHPQRRAGSDRRADRRDGLRGHSALTTRRTRATARRRVSLSPACATRPYRCVSAPSASGGAPALRQACCCFAMLGAPCGPLATPGSWLAIWTWTGGEEVAVPRPPVAAS